MIGLGFSARAAIFVDFDNVNGEAIRTDPAAWLRWLARRGGLGRGRSAFTVKRVYWHRDENGRDHSHIAGLRAAGFEYRSAQSLNPKKSSSDVYIAFECTEMLLTRRELDAFVLVSSDASFKPLVEGLLRARKRVCVIYTHEQASAPYCAWLDASGVVRIETGELAQDVEKWLEGRRSGLGARLRAFAAALGGRLPRRRTRRGRASAEDAADLDRVADDLVTYIRANDWSFISKRNFGAFLGRYDGFTPLGSPHVRWFGFSSHHGLMDELAGRHGRLSYRISSNGDGRLELGARGPR